MTRKSIPFSPPRMDDAIIKAVAEALKSGWITTGPRTKKFEEMLTKYAGHKKTLCVSSASAGLELMLRWYGVGPGDEVIVPAYTYSATANVVVHCGAKPVFVDSDRDFNIDLHDVKKRITSRTKVIMPVDIGGLPCDYDELNELVKLSDVRELFQAATKEQKILNRILIVSDAAHSLGAVYKGKKTGSLTDITVFSFHAVKNLTTAEGGAVCLNFYHEFDNDQLYDYLNTKSLHGQTKDAFSKIQIGKWKYDVIEPGYKFNMTDIAAAMGIVELERYESDMLPKRKDVFNRYVKAFSVFEWAELPLHNSADKETSYHVFLLRIKGISEAKRNMIMEDIFREGVSVNVHFVPLPMMTYYKNAGYDIRDYPVSYDSYSREITLPVYYDLTDGMIERIIEVVVKAVKKNL